MSVTHPSSDDSSSSHDDTEGFFDALQIERPRVRQRATEIFSKVAAQSSRHSFSPSTCTYFLPSSVEVSCFIEGLALFLRPIERGDENITLIHGQKT